MGAGNGANGAGDPGLPGDFKPVDGCVPDLINITDICGDAKRYVGLYAVGGFDVVAVNNGRVIYTTADRNGEFRRRFKGVAAHTGFDQPPPPAAAGPSGNGDAVLVYDCEQRRQWIAPRHSAVRFLYRQLGAE